MGGRLAGANLAGAVMPPRLRRFREIVHIDQTVTIARPIYLVLLLLCSYTIIAVLSTNDLNIITNRPIQLLPESALGVPTSGFLEVVPIFIFGMYAYLHIYIYKLWQNIGQLPSVFHDGTSLDQAISPWLVTAYVRFYQTHGVNRPSVLGVAQKWLTTLLVWWLAPVTLVLIWARYLVRHDWAGTWLHIVLVAITVFSAILLHRFAKAGLCRLARPLESRRGQALGVAALLGIGAVVFFLSKGAINAQREEFSWRDPTTWMPAVLELVNMPPCADLQRADLSGVDLSDSDLRCANLAEANLGYANPAKREGAASLIGADLRGADLTRTILSGADLRTARLDDARFGNANLEHARLSNTSLKHADFDGANLCYANLGSANFEDGRLSGAILYGADLSNANLIGVELSDADLRGADLSGADLRGAELGHALIRQALLRRTNLEGADTVGAVFDFADLKDAHGITQEQLDNACGQGVQNLPSSLVIHPCPGANVERELACQSPIKLQY
jgi:uncharacterized protein YjbI with pentapeptide repeats